MQPELWVWEPRAAGEWGSRKAKAEGNSHSRVRGAGIQSTGGSSEQTTRDVKVPSTHLGPDGDPGVTPPHSASQGAPRGL